MAKNINAGDVVRLASGGPLMTVEEVGPILEGDIRKARCLWFDGAKKESAIFNCNTLRVEESSND